MMTVDEVSRISGVSIRTLRYYDEIGLLPPSDRTPAGYRLYNETALETLQCILLFRELKFPLKEIRQILQKPGFDRNKALEMQIHLLELKKEHLENLIDLARGIQMIGVKPFMDFSAFDTKKIDEYAAQAKASWGTTPEYREFEQKSAGRTQEQNAALNTQLMTLFAQLGQCRHGDPASEEAQRLVQAIQDFITQHFYTCSDSILAGLGMMYTSGGALTDHIDRWGGAGTAAFANAAIRIHCARNEAAGH